MGMIQRMLETAAVRREQSDLGGTIAFRDCPEIPCAMGIEVGGIFRADNSAGFQENQTLRVIVRTALLADLPRSPQAGDTVQVKGNLETTALELVIQPTIGIEQFNAILTAFNLYNPNA